jgi:hypothetical protein
MCCFQQRQLLTIQLLVGGEVAYDISATDGITTGQWVGVDIPMSTQRINSKPQVTELYGWTTYTSGKRHLLQEQ